MNIELFNSLLSFFYFSMCDNGIIASDNKDYSLRQRAGWNPIPPIRKRKEWFNNLLNLITSSISISLWYSWLTMVSLSWSSTFIARCALLFKEYPWWNCSNYTHAKLSFMYCVNAILLFCFHRYIFYKKQIINWLEPRCSYSVLPNFLDRLLIC